MKKKQFTPKAGGSKPVRPGGSKPPKTEAAKVPKSTPVISTKTTITINPLQPPTSNEEVIPLVDLDYKIVDPLVDFNLL